MNKRKGESFTKEINIIVIFSNGEDIIIFFKHIIPMGCCRKNDTVNIERM